MHCYFILFIQADNASLQVSGAPTPVGTGTAPVVEDNATVDKENAIKTNEVETHSAAAPPPTSVTTNPPQLSLGIFDPL